MSNQKRFALNVIAEGIGPAVMQQKMQGWTGKRYFRLGVISTALLNRFFAEEDELIDYSDQKPAEWKWTEDGSQLYVCGTYLRPWVSDLEFIGVWIREYPSS